MPSCLLSVCTFKSHNRMNIRNIEVVVCHDGKLRKFMVGSKVVRRTNDASLKCFAGPIFARSETGAQTLVVLIP